jgi:putative Ca2+/H+ antiporter (TMEM165/GDT1 family)
MALQGSAQLLAVTYSAVLAGELIGDKSIFTVASLTLRLRPVATVCGIATAFMGKMLTAVLPGHLLTRMPPRWTSELSAATLLITAVSIWISRREERAQADIPVKWRSAVWVAF